MHFKFTKPCHKSELYVGYSDNSMGHSLNEPFVARANLTFWHKRTQHNVQKRISKSPDVCYCGQYLETM